MSERAGKNGKVPPKEYRFSRTYQPSPKAKSEGVRKWHDRQRLKDNILDVFSEAIGFQDGERRIIAMEAVARRVLKFLLEKNPQGMSAKQVELAIKLFDFLAPTESKVSVGFKIEKLKEKEILQIMAERVNERGRTAPGTAK